MGEWKEMKFSEFVDINPPITLSRSKEHFYIEMQDMDPSRRFAYPKRKRPLQGGSRFAEGDTLFARISPCTEKGNINQAAGLNGELGYGSTEFLVFRAKPGVSHEDFILYFSKWSEIKEYASNNLQGTSGRQRVAKEAFDQLDVIVPEVVEQRAIASVLSSLDAKIDLLHRQNKTLEAMAETLFRQWFVEEAEETWVEMRLDQFSTVGIGRTPPRKEQHWFSTDSADVKWISIKDMAAEGPFIFSTAEYLTEEAVERFRVPVIPKDTVVLSFKMTLGRVRITTEAMLSNEAIAHFRINADSYITKEFLYLGLKTYPYESLGTTSTIVDSINSGMIKGLVMQVPPVELMDRFMEQCGPWFEKIRSNQLQIQTLTALRDTLLPKLMSGEVRVGKLQLT